MRPVVAGMVAYDRLLDGTIGLAHLAEMNDALDVRDENEFRRREADKR